MSYRPLSFRKQIRLPCWYCATGPTYQTRSWETSCSEWQGAISPKLAGESHYRLRCPLRWFFFRRASRSHRYRGGESSLLEKSRRTILVNASTTEFLLAV